MGTTFNNRRRRWCSFNTIK